MSTQHTITVHTIAEDGFPPQDLAQAGLTGRVAFLFDGHIYAGWPVYREEEKQPTDRRKAIWEESETGQQMRGIEKWIEFPVPFWDL